MKKKIVILGSTGSIGKSSLKIISSKKKLFKVITLIANSDYNKICNQILNYRPQHFVITDKKVFNKIKKKFRKSKTKIFNHYSEIPKEKKKVDLTIAAIPGINGLQFTMDYTKKSKKILIANKESIICGWHIIKKISKSHRTEIIPLDSEHFSIYKLTQNNKDNEIDKIYITASGGPFLRLPFKKFSKIRPKDALKHPKWKMGKKISIDSATLMNKILELIEAQKIFPFSRNKYEIIIHPQSLVHAIVKFKNGLTNFLYHEPDMAIPISNAIFNIKNNINEFSYLNKFTNKKIKNLEFLKVEKKRFPVMRLIPKLNKHPSASIIINASNEILVDQFLKRKISFNSIIRHLFSVLRDKNYKKYAIQVPSNLKKIYMIDKWSRETTFGVIKNRN